MRRTKIDNTYKKSDATWWHSSDNLIKNVALNFKSDFTWKMKHLNSDPFIAGKELAIRAVKSILNTPIKSIDSVFWESVLEELQK